jgi:uncharacterized membrane protein
MANQMATQVITTPSRVSWPDRGTKEDFGRDGFHRSDFHRSMARGLGWFSIALGAAEIVMPRVLSRIIGVRPRPRAMRMMGVREVAAGIGILASRQPGPWLWARAGGDLMDMAALAGADSCPSSGRRIAAMAAVAGVTVADALCASKLSPAATHFTASVIVNRSPEECYAYWCDIAKFPQFMRGVKAVQVNGDGRSHWVARGPAGQELEWDAEVTENIPNESIAWRSLDESDSANYLPNSGRVRFEAVPGGRGTIVRLLMHYGAPFNACNPLGSMMPGVDPAQMVRRDLRRFKQIIEAGEIATTEGQPAGRRSGATWLDRAVRV